jgi:hypothetical protein
LIFQLLLLFRASLSTVDPFASLRRGGIAFLTSGVIFIIVAIVLTASVSQSDAPGCLSLIVHSQYKPSCNSSVCSYSLYYWCVSALAIFYHYRHSHVRWWFVIGGLFVGIGARNLIMARYCAPFFKQ